MAQFRDPDGNKLVVHKRKREMIGRDPHLALRVLLSHWERIEGGGYAMTKDKNSSEDSAQLLVIRASSLIRPSDFVIRLPRRSLAKAGHSEHVCIGR